MIILDTNVVSELIHPVPAPAVLAWVRGRSGNDLCTTATTVAQIRYGIARLPDGRRRTALAQAAGEVFAAILDRHRPDDRPTSGGEAAGQGAS